MTAEPITYGEPEIPFSVPGEVARYCLMVDGDRFPVEMIDRDPYGSGALVAAYRAAELSLDTGPVRLYVGERYLASFAHGRRLLGPA